MTVGGATYMIANTGACGVKIQCECCKSRQCKQYSEIEREGKEVGLARTLMPLPLKSGCTVHDKNSG